MSHPRGLVVALLTAEVASGTVKLNDSHRLSNCRYVSWLADIKKTTWLMRRYYFAVTVAAVTWRNGTSSVPALLARTS